MQIVIDISERIHYGIEKGITVNGSEASQILIDAVKNGTPLPKGHGRLIDVDALDKDFSKCTCKGDCNCLICPVYNQKVIIEADKESEDE